MEKWNIKKMLIIGAGGIGSFFIQHMNRLMLNNQIPIEIDITIVDNDKVEIKNVKYQNFTDKDILKNKATLLGDRYGFYGEDKKIIQDTELDEYDTFVLCVDNSKIRKMVYEHCYKNKKQFVDMRAEGRNIAVMTSDMKEEEAMATLPKVVSDNGGSCQMKYLFDAGIIDYGNVIVSAMGAQVLLNALRGDSYTPKTILRV